MIRLVARALPGAIVLAVLAGCSTTPRASTSQGSTTVSTTSSTSTTVPIAPATTTTSAAGPPEGYAAAKQEWENGAAAIAAEQGSFWTAAATDLSSALSGGASGTSGYQTAISELQQLASLPETGDTPAQMQEAQSDTAALNTFFGTPGLYQ